MDNMTILEFIKKNRIPQQPLAERMNVSYEMFRKKFSGTQIKFSESEIEALELVVLNYLEDLIKKLHENVKKDGV